MNIHILGGGLLGRLSALALAKQGFQVALHDSGGREGAQSAAYVAAAMLAPMAEAVDATALVLALGRQSVPCGTTSYARCLNRCFYSKTAA